MAASPRPARVTAQLFGAGAFALCALSSHLCFAQPEYVLSQVLFEAHPLTQADVAAPTQTGEPNVIATAGRQMPSASAPHSRFSFVNSPIAPTPTPLAPTRLDAERAIEAYQNTIVDTEGDTGPFSLDLVEQLVSLGTAYQQLNQHDEALATLEKAEYISRINNGLYAPNQFAVVERMVDSLIASGDMQEAMAKQQYLLYLNTQYYGFTSPQVVPALERLGDWSLEAFEKGVQGSKSIGIVVSGGVDPGFNGTGPRREPVLSPRAQSLINLDLAQRRYYQAISNLVDANDYRNPQLPVMEEKLLQSIYFNGHRVGLMKDPNFYLDARVDATGSRISHPEFETNMTTFLNGRNALTRTLIYVENNPTADPMARFVTLLNLGDWNALFNRMYEADQYYRQAWELAQTIPARSSEWEKQLAPEVPLQTPAFIALPHSRATFGIADDTPVEFDGYIDLELKLTRSGKVRSVKTLSMTDNVSPQLLKRLRRLVRSAPFRPTLVNGEAVSTNSKLVRYYFADMREPTRT